MPADRNPRHTVPQLPERFAQRKEESGITAPSLRFGLTNQPLVTIGGGAFGDLPAQAARLISANVAVRATRTFFMGCPPLLTTTAP
jgi:hypothetical protein